MEEIKFTSSAENNVKKVQAKAKIDLSGGKGLDSFDDILNKTITKDSKQNSHVPSRNVELESNEV